MVANEKYRNERSLFSPTRRGPALLHELKKMGQGIFIGVALLFAELAGALVELGSHFAGLVGWTAEGYEGGGQGIEFHKSKARMSRNPSAP
jgi:hypothetical protein